MVTRGLLALGAVKLGVGKSDKMGGLEEQEVSERIRVPANISSIGEGEETGAEDW